MAVQLSTLESIIEVRIDEATANLRAFDAQQKQVAKSAETSGSVIKKAFDGSSQPIQATAKEAQNLGDRLRDLANNTKEFSGGFLSGAMVEIREHFNKTGDAARGAGAESKNFAQRLKELAYNAKEFSAGLASGAMSAFREQFRGVSNDAKKAGTELARTHEDTSKKVKASNGILKESIESVSSEIIESFGIDGDVANMLATSMVNLKVSSLSAGGAVGLAFGAVAAVGAITIGVIAAVTSKMVSLAREGGELGAKFTDMSNSTGLAVSELTRYKILAEQSGSSLDKFTSGLSAVKEKFGEAADGNKELGKLFQEFGISAKQAADNPKAAFESLFKQIAKIEDPVLRAKVATAVAGESGAELVTTFATMAKTGDELSDRMNDLGLKLSDDVANGAKAVNNEFIVLGATGDALKIKIANEMGPELVKAVQSIEHALVSIAPSIISVGGLLAELFANTVDGARVAAGALKGYALAILAGKNPAGSALGAGLAGGQAAAAGISEERRKASNAVINRDAANALAIEEELQGRLDGTTQKKNAAIKAGLKGISAKKGGKSSAPEPITPVDTISSTKQLRDAELAVQESTARASIGVAKAEADEKRKILEMQYADGLVNTRAYYDQRLTLEATAIDREIAEQRRIIAVEKQRAIEAEGDTQKEIERINKLEAAKLAKAKTPKQREAIQEDKTNRITNANNQLEAERDKHLAKQIEAEGKITELQSKRSGQIASTTRDEIKANKALENSFSDLILEAQRATNQDYETEAKAIGEKFTDKIALAIREGRPDVIEAIKTLTGVELAKARGAKANKNETIIRAGADKEQARIQNELNQGIISEVTARRQQIEVQAKYRQAIVAEMEVQREAALAANDYVKAAQIAVDIERQRGAGLEEDQNVRAIREKLTNSFDDFEKSLVYGQKTIGEALRELARSTITSILEQVQQSIVENLTGEKTIGAALAKAISGKLAGIFKIGQTPTLPGTTGEDASKLVIKNLVGNRETLTKNIEDLGSKTVEAARVAAEKQAQELAKIAQSNLEMANCACAPAQGPSILGQVLGAVIGAVGAGIAGGGGGGAKPSGGYPAGFIGMSQGYKKDGGMIAFADAGGMCGGGHVGTAAGYAAVGKMIRGPGGPRDDKIPMWLSDGEYVTDAATVEKLGPEFFRMLPALASAGKMADGGFVADMLGGGSNASQPLPMPRSEARNQQQGKTISVVNHFVIQAPRGSVSAETQQQILTKAAMGMNAALARNT